MRPYLPGTVEKYVWLIKFFKNGEPYGIYIPAEHQADAEIKFRKRLPDAEITEIKMVFEKGENDGYKKAT